MSKSHVLELRGCPYAAYYREQAGSGISRVYSGASYQKGNGIGSLLGSLFRWVSPLLKRGAIALGHKAVNMGGKVMADVTSGHKVRESLKRRFKEEIQGGNGSKRIKGLSPKRKFIRRRSRARETSPDIYTA